MNNEIIDEETRYTKTKRCCLPSYLRCEKHNCKECSLFKAKKVYAYLPPGRRSDLPKIVIKCVKRTYHPKDSSDILDRMDDFWREAEKHQKNRV